MKPIFPMEFSDLLNQKGLKILKADSSSEPIEKLAVAQNIIRKDYVDNILSALESKVFPLLKNYHAPIPEELIPKLKKNYTETLGKSMRIKSSDLNSRRSMACRVAADIGLTAMMSSQSFRQMGEQLLGSPFGPSVSKQVICYGAGDYVSPHNDHHPEDAHLKNGYFDIQLMLSNRHVRHQWLVYEKDGFLNSMVNIATESGIAAYRLPFWHYTTPLLPNPRNGGVARRWLLLHSFELGGSSSY